MRGIQLAGYVAALTAVAPLGALPKQKRIPVRQISDADAERIAAAQKKRARKAEKRATQAAKEQST